VLNANRLRAVRLELVPGVLSDRYDGERQALGLSREVAAERSVAAIEIAAHEVAHAYQDAGGSRSYRLRLVASALPGLFFAPSNAGRSLDEIQEERGAEPTGRFARAPSDSALTR
jgi:Zn-dependent membrane protease YugP